MAVTWEKLVFDGHTHDGDTLQIDGINSDGGAFSFTTSGAVTFSQNLIMADGKYIGQAAGPQVTFDDTNNYLEIMGCDVGIGSDTPVAKLYLYHNLADDKNLLWIKNDNNASTGVAAIIRQDGTGDILQLKDSGADVFVVADGGGIFMGSLKSGTDQADAGAAANELYIDTDDNTVKRGT